MIRELTEKAATEEACALREQRIADHVLQQCKAMQDHTDEKMRSIGAKLDAVSQMAPNQHKTSAYATQQLSAK